jgi:Tfp pilus assembly protein PilF
MDARIQLGNLYLLLRDNPKAREQAEKVLSKEPNNPSGHLLMSSVYVVEKDLDKAMGHYSLGLAHLGNRDIQQAKAELAEAVKLNPNWNEARIVLAEVNLETGAFDLAIQEA